LNFQLSTIRNVIILGSGPAGLTAAIYTGRALLEPLVVEGVESGGQLTKTSEVENFPGFPDGIGGAELIERMRAQAERFGAVFLGGNAEAVHLDREPFVVQTAGQLLAARSLIIATGARPRLLGLESERALFGRGVSTCATCDAFFYRDRTVFVVGGGDSALDDAIFLTRFARRVYIVHRRDRLRASSILQERALKNPKIEILWNSIVEEIYDASAGKVTGVRLRNTMTGETEQRDADGIFIAIGHEPNTEIFRGKLALDDHGYIITGAANPQLSRRATGTSLHVNFPTQTSIPGVFAAGDVVDTRYRQAITAAGSGCRAALDAERFLQTEG
jgi:thioredoxin reductase (NADPH)